MRCLFHGVMFSPCVQRLNEKQCVRVVRFYVPILRLDLNEEGVIY